MSKWSDADPVEVRRASIVGEYGPDDISTLDYLREHSQADPEGVEA
jgi:hypothetical protein